MSLMSQFSQRSQQSELMDTETVSFDIFYDCLNDLETINFWTRAYKPTEHWLKQALLILTELPDNLYVWDIGSGGGGMLRHLWKMLPTHKQWRFLGLDMNPWSEQVAMAMTSDEAESIDYETANIFQINKNRHADFIISALFTHHLTNEELVTFIRWMEAHATHGWFINDLHRHPIPYFFIKYAVRLFNMNRLVQHDAPVSVMRAFTLEDWHRLLNEADIPIDAVSIQWHAPFRYGIGRYKT
jgi:2-polyprenyl-3-methyl-5-hydroxy-6-metoxy-1,4-benzoquinol methylase